MFRIPILHRFTCSPHKLSNYIQVLKQQNILPILDYINEDKKDSHANLHQLHHLIHTYPNNYIAVKLSSLNIEQTYNKVVDDSLLLAETAIKTNSKLLIDAEYYQIQPNIDKIANILMSEFNRDHVHIYKTYQMYRKDTFPLLQYDILKERDYYLGVKLVRGAYYNRDKHYHILHTKIEDTHAHYNKSIQFFSEHHKDKDVLMLATHNKDSIQYAQSLLYQSTTNPKHIEFAQLLGLSDHLTHNLVKDGYKVFKYLPYGHLYDTFPYLARRLYDNWLIIKNIIH